MSKTNQTEIGLFKRFKVKVKGSVPLEYEEQKVVKKWRDEYSPKFPDIAMLFSIPYGLVGTMFTMAKIKAAGSVEGVPDYFLPVPLGGFHGLFIEMKRSTFRGKPLEKCMSIEQRRWLVELQSRGYSYQVCFSAHEAIRAVELYLGIDTGILGPTFEITTASAAPYQSDTAVGTRTGTSASTAGEARVIGIILPDDYKKRLKDGMKKMRGKK